jgi:hypothetical protein
MSARPPDAYYRELERHLRNLVPLVRSVVPGAAVASYLGCLDAGEYGLAVETATEAVPERRSSRGDLLQAGLGAVAAMMQARVVAPSVLRVFARVNLQSSAQAELPAREATAGDQPKRVIMMSGNPENLSLHVSLSAQDSTGRHTRTLGRDFGIGGPRHGVWHRWHGPPLPEDRVAAERIVLREHRADQADIEDGINQMLGRDPKLHHPPRLSWHNLIRALNAAGMPVTEQELIAAPLTVELTPEVLAELGKA